MKDTHLTITDQHARAKKALAAHTPLSATEYTEELRRADRMERLVVGVGVTIVLSGLIALTLLLDKELLDKGVIYLQIGLGCWLFGIIVYLSLFADYTESAKPNRGLCVLTPDRLKNIERTCRAFPEVREALNAWVATGRPLLDRDGDVIYEYLKIAKTNAQALAVARRIGDAGCAATAGNTTGLQSN